MCVIPSACTVHILDKLQLCPWSASFLQLSLGIFNGTKFGDQCDHHTVDYCAYYQTMVKNNQSSSSRIGMNVTVTFKWPWVWDFQVNFWDMLKTISSIIWFVYFPFWFRLYFSFLPFSMQNSDADVSKLMLIAVNAVTFSETLWIALGNLIEIFRKEKRKRHKLK